MKHIISFSGGKDSTAMTLMLLEREREKYEIVFCDTGKEFPEMYRHIDKIERYIDKSITVVKNDKSFDYWMFDHVKKNKNAKNPIGFGWALLFKSRWCTNYMKTGVITKYLSNSYGKNNYIEHIGIAFDEYGRYNDKLSNKYKNYPLVEWKITEGEALKYCYDRGFDWEGLYTRFNRVSCWCCPFANLKELRNLYVFYPELWEKLKDMDNRSWNSFRERYSVQDLEDRFREEIKRTGVNFDRLVK